MHIELGIFEERLEVTSGPLYRSIPPLTLFSRAPSGSKVSLLAVVHVQIFDLVTHSVPTGKIFSGSGRVVLSGQL